MEEKGRGCLDLQRLHLWFYNLITDKLNSFEAIHVVSTNLPRLKEEC